MDSKLAKMVYHKCRCAYEDRSFHLLYYASRLSFLEAEEVDWRQMTIFSCRFQSKTLINYVLLIKDNELCLIRFLSLSLCRLSSYQRKN